METVRKFFTDRLTRAKILDQVKCHDAFGLIHDEVSRLEHSSGIFVAKQFSGRIANITLENGLEVCAIKDNASSHFGVALSIKAGS